MNPYHVIKRPLITEKSVALQATSNHYAFVVSPQATKTDVRLAIEFLFKVKVAAVRTMNLFGKERRVGKSVGRRSDWKKALVTLAEGQKIEFGEGNP